MPEGPTGALAVAHAAVDFAHERIRERGEVRLKASRLWVGDRPFLGDTDVVDAVYDAFGYGCTVFRGNLRIATTVVAMGGTNRALGTRANATVTQLVYRRGRRFSGITRTIGKDFVIVYDPLRESTGRVVGMIACYRDLRDYSEDLSQLDSADEVVVLHRVDGTILDANQAAADMCGIPRDALEGRSLYDILDLPDLQGTSLASAEDDELEGTLTRSDQHVFPVVVSSRECERDGPARMTMVRDFTAQHAARSRVEALNAQLAQLNRSLEEQVRGRTRQVRETLAQRDAMVANLSDGLVATGSDGTIDVINPALQRMLGGRAVGAGQHIALLEPSLAQLVTDVLATHASHRVDVSLALDRIGEAACSPILVEGNEGVRCVGTVTLVRDITKAREVERMKNDFIATISHELRTPLTSVLGFARVSLKRLRQRIAPAVSRSTDDTALAALTQVDGNLEVIASEGQRLTTLIEDVLDMSRIEAGEVVWRDEPLQLVPLIDRAAATTRALFEESGLTLRVVHAEHLPTLRGDPQRILQVLLNLLTNAARFTEDGTVELGARAVDGAVEIWVRDSGVGIATADHERIFEWYAHLDDTRRDTGSGTGLGLAISRRIVRRHRGSIRVESEPGRGTCFTVTLTSAPDPRKTWAE